MADESKEHIINNDNIDNYIKKNEDRVEDRQLPEMREEELNKENGDEDKKEEEGQEEQKSAARKRKE